jgi:hypothetical protein
MKRFVLTLVAAVAVIALAMPAQADFLTTVVENLDFSTSPITSHGFVADTGTGWVDPDSMLNTAAGKWDVNMVATDARSLYHKDSLGAVLAGTTDPYFGGEATIKMTTASAIAGDVGGVSFL